MQKPIATEVHCWNSTPVSVAAHLDDHAVERADCLLNGGLVLRPVAVVVFAILVTVSIDKHVHEWFTTRNIAYI